MRRLRRQTGQNDVHDSWRPQCLLPWFAGGFLALLVLLFALQHYLAPLPPRSLIMTTGAPGGAYAVFAERYREILARHGIRVELKPSSGAVENLRRLKGVDGDADIGFLQGGITHEPKSDDLVTLGAMYYEPIWVFLRPGINAASIAELRGKKIAIGLQGGGGQLLTLEVLTANGFAINDPGLLPIAGDEAVAALRSGKVDALMTVNGAEAPIVKTLLAEPGVALMDFAQADAYARRLPHLSKLVLPRGTIDLVRDIPPHDIQLVAPTANLVARADLHPALVSLLMKAAQEIHRQPGLLAAGNEFPAPRDHDLPQSAEATRFYSSGPPLLQRVLPFWAAVLLDRAIWTLVPLLALLIPISRVLPAALRWRIRSRIYRWYGELKFIEEEARRQPEVARVAELLRRLDEIERLLARRKVPLSYANELYILREHIQLVRNELRPREHRE